MIYLCIFMLSLILYLFKKENYLFIKSLWFKNNLRHPLYVFKLLLTLFAADFLDQLAIKTDGNILYIYFTIP